VLTSSMAYLLMQGLPSRQMSLQMLAQGSTPAGDACSAA
jgi:hypothetical protein